MEKCFIIQPFDKDVFDKRYADIFEPAIKAADLVPYRVDRDFSVKIPIEQIEEGIKSSIICFAEITSDNPNVWYELGYAFASKKDVIMVCSDERKGKFPFDIQHKQIVTYKTSSKSDFDNLEKQITQRLKALLEKQKNVSKFIENPVKESEGLKSHEVTMLLIIMENQLTAEDKVSAFAIKNDMEKAGFAPIATSVGFRELQNKNYIDLVYEEGEYDNQGYWAYKLTKMGEQWVLDNQDKIEFRKSISSETESNDLPF